MRNAVPSRRSDLNQVQSVSRAMNDPRHLRLAAEQLLLALGNAPAHKLASALDRYEREHLSSPKLAAKTVAWRKRSITRLRRFADRELDGSWRNEALEIYREFPRPTASLIVNTLATVLRAADRWSMRTGDHGIHDLSQVFSEHRERWLTVDEIAALSSAIDKLRENPRFGNGVDALWACVLLPLRVSAVVEMEWKNIPADCRTVVATDKAKIRRLQVGVAAAELLRRRRRLSARSPFVFPGRDDGTHVSRVTVLRTIRIACDMAEVDRRGVCVHTLRHSYATNLLLQGATSDDIQESLGHSAKHVTRRYLHVCSTRVRDAADNYASAIAQAKAVRS